MIQFSVPDGFIIANLGIKFIFRANKKTRRGNLGFITFSYQKDPYVGKGGTRLVIICLFECKFKGWNVFQIPLLMGGFRDRFQIQPGIRSTLFWITSHMYRNILVYKALKLNLFHDKGPISSIFLKIATVIQQVDVDQQKQLVAYNI